MKQTGIISSGGNEIPSAPNESHIVQNGRKY
jgi:hypothetical protein